MLRQYDLSRAIPRHVRDVTVFKGDILTLTTSQGRVFSSGVDGSLRYASLPVPLPAGAEMQALQQLLSSIADTQFTVAWSSSTA